MGRVQLAMILAAAAAASPLWAQMAPGMPARPEQQRLAAYLELTVAQMASLVRLEAEWQLYLAEKARRVMVVEREIAQERSREVMDVAGLGIRVQELELICREARERDRDTMRRAREVLTPAQRTKLQTLEQAYALMPTIREADLAHLVEAPGLPAMAGPGAGEPNQNYPGCLPRTGARLSLRPAAAETLP